jgi:hypothetical protein
VLRVELGLKLESRRSSIEMPGLNRVERPTQN